MRKLLLSGLLSLIAVGANAEIYAPSSEVLVTPTVGEISNADIGDPMIAQVEARKYKAIYFSEPQTINRTTIGRGYYKETITKDGYVQYDSTSAPQAGMISPYGSMPWLYLRSSDNAICLSSEWSVKPNTKTCTPLKFENKDWVYADKDALEQRLIYNGKSGKKIKIGYREFINGMARPSFSNDIEYDLADSKQIGYKGALIEVIEANNQGIKYKILKGFK